MRRQHVSTRQPGQVQEQLGKLAKQRSLAWLPAPEANWCDSGVVITFSEIGPLLKKIESARFVRLIELSWRKLGRF